jgi:predicted metal-dependent phosphoesterase TrpH
LLDYLTSENFGLVAITDHDRVDTVAALQQLAIQKHMPVLVAVEMSTSWKGEATDVLCYGFDPEKNALNDLARDVLRRQQENTRAIYESLRQQGLSFSHPDELTAILETPSAQQLNELIALLEKHGYGADETSRWEMIKSAGFFWATTDIAAVVDATHRSGGVCLLAHPGRGEYWTRYDVSLLGQLRQEVPIDGLEVYHPTHMPEQIAMYLAYAQQHNLLVSSSSDSHGPDKKPIKYRADLSRRLLERVGIQVK